MGRLTMQLVASSAPRRHLRALGFLLAALAVVGSTYIVAALRPTQPDAPAPRPVETGAPIVAFEDGGAPVVSLAQIDHSIDAWTRNLDANPKDFLAATNLATLYQGRGRLSYDLTDHERALAAARSALAIEPSHAPARVIEAAILFTLHDFSAAHAAADGLLRADPSQAGALVTRFDAAVELGRIDEARDDLDRLRSVGGAAVRIRAARLASVTGDHDRALAEAILARDAALAEETGDLGFYHYAVGEYARLAGDAIRAREGFAAALAIRDGDVAALIGLARIDAYEGRTDDAIAGLQRATAIAPQPEALALLGDLHTAAGSAGEADKAYDTVRFIERLGDVQAATFDRQLLRFELDHGGAVEDVLDRARASVDARPDASGHDLIAWALYRLGRYEEAAASIDSARSLGADDARLRFHEGAVRLALGDGAAASALLSEARLLGPALDPIERAEVARLLAS
jgi:tetratricopeptide (TPR) repeat protein